MPCDAAELGLNREGRAGRIERGIAISYACFNCCPDSFTRGSMVPDSITGFPGDETLCDAFQQDENCYGTPMEPFRVDPYWTSDNPGVATIADSGLATAQSEGSARLRGRWPAFIYVDTGSYGCESGLLHPVVNAVCNVLAPKVIFKDVTWSTKKADFDLPFNDATLNLGGDTLTALACGGEQFAINVTFYQPEFSTGCCGNGLTNFVKLSADNDFQLLAEDYEEVGTTQGTVSITLRRRGEGRTNKVLINVSGSYQNGTSWDGRGTVRLVCP